MWMLSIGEAEIKYDLDDDILSITTGDVYDDNAPEGSNNLSVPLAYLTPFSKRVGLEEMFYGGWDDVPFWENSSGNGLVAKHRGIAPLTINHLHAVENALKRTDLINGDRQVLEWLRYWIKWSLENCKIPSFYSRG